jgi:hypothetical protein
MPSNLRALFGVFSDSAKPISQLMDDIDKEAALALKSSVVRGKHMAVRSASVVLLSGLLESFLRQSAEAFFEDLGRRGLKYDELPADMRATHFVAGLEWAQKVAKSDRKGDPNFNQTRVALGRLTEPASKGLPALVWQAFANTKGNPGPDVIADYLRSFGVKDPLKAVSEAGGADPGFLRISLESFISLRNECAHTGTSKNAPQPSEIRDLVHLLRRLALGVSKVLDVKLSEIYAKAVAARS